MIGGSGGIVARQGCTVVAAVIMVLTWGYLGWLPRRVACMGSRPR